MTTVHQARYSDITDPTGTYPAPGENMYTSRLVAVVLAIALLATLDVAAYTYGGAPIGITVLITSLLAFAGWITTTGRRAASRPAAFNLYIGTLIALTVLETEQWYFHMPTNLMRLYPRAFPSGVGISDHTFIAIFPLAASGLLLLGALAYYHSTDIGRFAAWLTFAWAIVGSLAIYAYALLADVRIGYLGGMVTAPLPIVIALIGMRRLVLREGIPDKDSQRSGR